MGYIIAIIIFIFIIYAVISAIGVGVSIIYENKATVIKAVVGIAIVWWILNNLEFAISHWYAFVGCVVAYFIFKKVQEREKENKIERERQARIREEEEKRKRDEILRNKVLETVNKMGMADVSQIASRFNIDYIDAHRYLDELVVSRDIDAEEFGGGKKLYKTKKKINGETIYEVDEINLD